LPKARRSGRALGSFSIPSDFDVLNARESGFLLVLRKPSQGAIHHFGNSVSGVHFFGGFGLGADIRVVARVAMAKPRISGVQVRSEAGPEDGVIF
jgi:hypothetical protein